MAAATATSAAEPARPGRFRSALLTGLLLARHETPSDEVEPPRAAKEQR